MLFRSGYASSVGGGLANGASASYATVSGGYGHGAFAVYSTISGGKYNATSALWSTVSGGYANLVSVISGFVGGGYFNKVCNSASPCSSYGAVVVGGVGNNTTGGTWSLASCCFTVNPTICNAGQYSFIGGGFQNRATGTGSAISGGDTNTASGLQ